MTQEPEEELRAMEEEELHEVLLWLFAHNGSQAQIAFGHFWYVFATNRYAAALAANGDHDDVASTFWWSVRDLFHDPPSIQRWAREPGVEFADWREYFVGLLDQRGLLTTDDAGGSL